MRSNEAEVIDWKTGAWKDPAMVAWYSGRMAENTGTNRLKNQIEVQLCARFARGRDLLDVGIGTGRASLPLVSDAVRLTGTDSSQAMLDECRRLAAGAPVELVPGDVRALPFADASFDSLISLNVMTHFPHVENVLQEWKRVVRTGGRLIFDVYSLDHLRFARGREVSVEELLAQKPGEFNMHLANERLVAAANALGMRIRDVVPYGSAFSGEYRHWSFPMPLQASNWWRRQLSWMGTDDALLNLAAFLDNQWFGRLSTIATGRFMVILENSPDRDSNERWLAGQFELNSRLASGSTCLDDLADRLTMPPDVWRRTFDSHLDGLRCRMVAYFLLATFLGRPDAVDWVDLAPRNGPALRRWADAERCDRRLLGFARDWHRHAAVAGAVMRHGVDLGASLEYPLQQQLVAGVGTAALVDRR